MGVFRCVEKELYGEALDAQVERAVRRLGEGDYHDYIRSGETWDVSP
jgi:hypothetical protein